jgi:hypothetical protein
MELAVPRGVMALALVLAFDSHFGDPIIGRRLLSLSVHGTIFGKKRGRI